MVFMNVDADGHETILYKVFNEDLYGINTSLKFKYTWSQVLAYEWQDDAIRQWLAEQTTPPDDTKTCYINDNGERWYDIVISPYKMVPIKLEVCWTIIELRDEIWTNARIMDYTFHRITNRDKTLPKEIPRYWTDTLDKDDMYRIRARCILLKEELAAAVMHPDRIGPIWLDAT